MEPGELYWATLPNAPRHPVVVLSRQELNRGHNVLVALLTSSRFDERRFFPNCVPLLAGSFGLSKNCVIQAQSIFSLEQSDLDLDDGPIGRLDDSTHRALIRAAGYVLAAECEPT